MNHAVLGHGCCAKDCSTFIQAFFPLQSGHRVVDDAAPRFDIKIAVLNYGRANGDGGVHVAIPCQISHGATVNAALDRL